MPRALLQSSGPVPPDSVDVWSAVLGAAASPPAQSARTVLVHEYDDKQGIYAIRAGPWKLAWGKVGTSEWIADLDYGSGCGTLLPPVNSSGGWSGAGSSAAFSKPKPPPPGPGQGLVCTHDAPCLFQARASHSLASQKTAGARPTRTRQHGGSLAAG